MGVSRFCGGSDDLIMVFPEKKDTPLYRTGRKVFSDFAVVPGIRSRCFRKKKGGGGGGSGISCVPQTRKKKGV